MLTVNKDPSPLARVGTPQSYLRDLGLREGVNSLYSVRVLSIKPLCRLFGQSIMEISSGVNRTKRTLGKLNGQGKF